MSPSARSRLNPPRRKPTISQANPAIADVTVTRLLLDGRPFDADIIEAVNDIGVTRSIDGTSTLTISLSDPAVGDPPRPRLLNSRVLRKAVDLDLDDLVFRLADIDLSTDDGGIELDLAFEARPVARLRRFTGAKHASRADKTRAEFIKSLCDEADIPFVCPDLRKRQPIQSVEDAMSPSERRTERRKGLKKGVKVTVKGKAADSEQLKVLGAANDVADSRSAPALAQLALNMALIQESTARNLTGGDADSSGPLQVRASTARGITVKGRQLNPRDTEAVSDVFLTRGYWGKGGAIALAQAHPDWSPGRIAQNVQGSAFPTAYDAHRAEAQKIMEAFGASGAVAADEPAETYAVPYMFKRLGASETTDGKPEDSWTCVRRLADEVNWRLWEEAGSIVFMHDARILRSVVQMTIEPGTEGIDGVSGRLSNRKDRQELTISCQARRWAAPPGTVAEVEGYGKFDGRWIVAKIERPSLFVTATTITLAQREKAVLEPAHEVRTRDSASEDGPAGTASDIAAIGGLESGSIRQRVVAVAKEAAKRSAGDPSYYHYSQAGSWKNDVLRRDNTGRGPQGLPGGPGNRSDCSSFVIGVFAKAGCKLPKSMRGQGFTGTLADVGEPTQKPRPGDVCLYGSYPYKHCELYIGDGKTIGHGTAPVDYSTPRGPGNFAGYWTFYFLNEGGTTNEPVAGPHPNP